MAPNKTNSLFALLTILLITTAPVEIAAGKVSSNTQNKSTTNKKSLSNYAQNWWNAKKYKADFFKAVRGGNSDNGWNVRTVKDLIENKGVDVNATTTSGNTTNNVYNIIDNVTALMLAVTLDSILLVDLLIKHNADVNLKTSTWNTALYFAAGEGHLMIAKQLIENGAMIANGLSPLYAAAKYGHIDLVNYLLAQGARSDAKVNGRSIIHAAAKSKNLAVVKRIVESGVDLSVTSDNTSETAHDVAGSEEIKNYLKLAEDFYALGKKTMKVDDFIDTYLADENKQNANLLDIFNLLHLYSKNFSDQKNFIAKLVAFEKMDEILNNSDDNKKRWVYVSLAQRPGKDKLLWLRESFKFLGGKPEFLYRTFNQAVTNAIKTLPEKDRPQLTKEMNIALQQKNGYLALPIKIPKNVHMPKVTLQKEAGSVTKKPDFTDTKIIFNPNNGV